MNRQEFIERVYTEYQQLMYSVAQNILQDSYLAEDVVHECVIRLYKAKALNIDSITSPSTKSLVRVVARNEANRMYRKHIKGPYHTESIEKFNLTAADLVSEPFVTYVEIEDFMKAVDPIYKDVAILRCHYGFEYDQIGRLLGIKTQTVKNRMVKLRKLLREYWEESYGA